MVNLYRIINVGYDIFKTQIIRHGYAYKRENTNGALHFGYFLDEGHCLLKRCNDTYYYDDIL